MSRLFPKDEPRRSKWILAVRRKDWLPTEYSRLCSEHFSGEMFDRSMKLVLLKPFAVPTIFKSFPAHLQKTEPKRINRKTQEKPQPEIDEINPPSTSVFPSKEECKRALEEAEEENKKSKKKIKLLQQAKRRYKKKICDLTGINSLSLPSSTHDSVPQVIVILKNW